jgi:hypothetical protein
VEDQEHSSNGAQVQARRNFSGRLREWNVLLKVQGPGYYYENAPPQIETEELLQEEKIDFSYALSQL